MQGATVENQLSTNSTDGSCGASGREMKYRFGKPGRAL
jgi:hypothetical protein